MGGISVIGYKEAIVQSMRMLAQQENVLFIGQSVRYSGHAMFNTLEDAKVPMSKRLELPVIEEFQLGYSQGRALVGCLPVSIFPRIDFLMCAMNQLVNHLDKWEEMSHGEFNPKVIIRTMVGSKNPLNPGPQHCQDHTEALRLLCPNLDIYKLDSVEKVLGNYEKALASSRSSILIEMGDLYD